MSLSSNASSAALAYADACVKFLECSDAWTNAGCPDGALWIACRDAREEMQNSHNELVSAAMRIAQKKQLTNC